MQRSRVFVQTPARLHFGLFSFGNEGRQFGGVGVMVQRPSVNVEFRESDRFAVDGLYAECVEQGARRWAKATGADALPACRITVHSAPRRHVGLGSGTQLALCVATGLCAWHRLPVPAVVDLARFTGRGGRSALGTYGFLHGGFIVESGKLPNDELAPLRKRLEVPYHWRFVLVRVGDVAGLHGASEHKAFNELPPVTAETRTALEHEVDRNMIPALQENDWRGFGESVYQFGRRAGACFAPVQGGPYNGQRIAAMVEEIRSLGVPGVGQSSWGPTLFCILPDQNTAESFARELGSRHKGEDLDVRVTAVDNQGAQVTIQ